MRSARLPVALALMAVAIPVAAVATTAAGAEGTSLGSLSLSVLPERTVVASGKALRVTLAVRSTGTQAATAVTACMVAPPQLTVERAPGATRSGRTACFALGDLASGAVESRTVVLRAAARRTAAVRVLARATSTCRCSGRPTARSPVIRVVRATTRAPRVTG